MRVTLARTEMAVFCNQARLLMGLRHQSSLKTFSPQTVLPARCTVATVAPSFWEKPTNDRFNKVQATREPGPNLSWMARIWKRNGSEILGRIKLTDFKREK